MPTQPSRELVAVPNPHPGRDYEVCCETPEFTCVCPMTGQPDFARVTITYVPGPSIVELKSLKLYLWSYRDEGAFHEDGVRYERLAPMQQWRVTADADAMVIDLGDKNVSSGRLVLNATFSALTPPVGTDGQGREQAGLSAVAAASVGKGHLEQAGGWRGSITFDGTEFVWGDDARGNRDKSWGPRRW